MLYYMTSWCAIMLSGSLRHHILACVTTSFLPKYVDESDFYLHVSGNYMCRDDSVLVNLTYLAIEYQLHLITGVFVIDVPNRLE